MTAIAQFDGYIAVIVYNIAIKTHITTEVHFPVFDDIQQGML
jgi:hypothetical protein